MNELEMSTLTINELYDSGAHMKINIMHILMTVNFYHICANNLIGFIHLSILFIFFFQNKGDAVMCSTFLFLPLLCLSLLRMLHFHLPAISPCCWAVDK